MKTYDVVRMPLMTSAGDWITVPVGSWKVYSNLGAFDLRSGSFGANLPLSNVIALQIGDEKQVRAVGKTLGRMALTGVGAALFTKGDEGGIGAGLLDLSFRGAERKTIVSGLLIFQNTGIVRFTISSSEFESLVNMLPAHVASEEAMAEANTMFALLDRLKADGERVLGEMVVTLIERRSEAAELTALAASGATFQERDEARQLMLHAELQLKREKSMLAALLYDFGINPSQFVADHPSLALADFQSPKPKASLGAPAAASALSQPSAATSQPTDVGKILLIICGGFVVLMLFLAVIASIQG